MIRQAFLCTFISRLQMPGHRFTQQIFGKFSGAAALLPFCYSSSSVNSM